MQSINNTLTIMAQLRVVILLLITWSSVGHMSGQDLDFITVSNGCESSHNGIYYYDTHVNGRPSYFNGDVTISWSNTDSQWQVKTIEYGEVDVINNTDSAFPPVGYGSAWTAVYSGCSGPGIFGGSTSFIYISDPCFGGSSDVFCFYNGIINGKSSYENGDNKVFWDGVRWVVEDEIGLLFINTSDTTIPPHGSESTWITLDSSCPVDYLNITGPDYYIYFTSECYDYLNGIYTYNGINNGKSSYKNGDNNILWSGSQWEMIDEYGLAYSNNTNSTEPDIGSWISETVCVDTPYIGGANSTQLSALPVELITFEGQKNNYQVLLSWQTISEINNEKFEIEESLDGYYFTKIGEVEGNVNTYTIKHYTFTVRNPREGMNYYRLKQMDFDGAFEYSEVISVDFNSSADRDVSIYPNPSPDGLVYVNYSSRIEDELTVSIYDTQGRLMLRQNRIITEGRNQLPIDCTKLSDGMYMVKIDSGDHTNFEKLVIGQ